jgi:preprotein translocase subunit SecG
MQTVLIVVHLIIVMTMIGLVLLQRSEGGGLGMGGGGFMTNRGSSNVLSRTTALLAGAFFVTSIVLSIMAGYDRRPASILAPGSSTPSSPTAPSSLPQAPLGTPGGGVLDALRQREQQPAAPSGPQVPRSQ